jgi:hypothetical protein
VRLPNERTRTRHFLDFPDPSIHYPVFSLLKHPLPQPRKIHTSHIYALIILLQFPSVSSFNGPASTEKIVSNTTAWPTPIPRPDTRPTNSIPGPKHALLYPCSARADLAIRWLHPSKGKHSCQGTSSSRPPRANSRSSLTKSSQFLKNHNWNVETAVDA